MTGSSSDERGFTLVELMVSMTIIVMTLLGSLYVAIGYFRTSHDNYSRTTAIQIASEQMETMKAVGWSDLGFYASDNAPACPASLPCTAQAAAPSLGTTRPSGAAAPVPTKTVTRGNVAFTVTSYITSVVTPATTDAGRRIVVQVTWSIRGRNFTAQIDALRSPVFAETSGTVSATPTATPAPSAGPVGPTTFSALTTPAGTPCLKNTVTTNGFVIRITAANAVSTDSIVVKRSSTDSGFANAGDGTGNSTAMNFDVAIPANTTFPGALSGQNDSGNYPLTIELTKSSDNSKVTGSGSFAYTSTNQC